MTTNDATTGITIRRAEDRGKANYGWLDARYSFSFARYYDPEHMGFRDLRVINEDRVQPGQGFGTHGHRDMEIITYPISGALQHKDSMGNGSVLHAGTIQRMSAGTGIEHSEFNASESEMLHLLQIWILPGENGIEPGWEEKDFSEESRTNQLRLVVSPDAREGSLKVHQDFNLYASLLEKDAQTELKLRPGRHAWVQVARGNLELNGESLHAGDGAAISDTAELHFKGLGARSDADAERAEFLVFDLK